MTKVIKNIFKESYNKHIVLLSSSSTFFVLISIIPFLLLCLKAIGLLLGNPTEQANNILELILYFLPENLEGLADPIKSLVMKSFFASKEFTTVNVCILVASSLGLINSIWRALLILTDDEEVFNYKKYLRSFILIFTTILFFISTLLIPLLLKVIENFLSLGFVQSTLDFLHLENISNFTVNYIFNNGYIVAFLLIIYMSIFFNLILGKKACFKNSMIGSFIFFLLFFLLRIIFNYYIALGTSSLVSSYGNYYGFIFGLLWVFALMFIFYFSIIVSLCFEEKDKETRLINTELPK